MNKDFRMAIEELSDDISREKMSMNSSRERKRPVKISCGCSFDGNQFYYSLYWGDSQVIWEGKSDLTPEGFADEFFNPKNS